MNDIIVESLGSVVLFNSHKKRVLSLDFNSYGEALLFLNRVYWKNVPRIFKRGSNWRWAGNQSVDEGCAVLNGVEYPDFADYVIALRKLVNYDSYHIGVNE